VEFAVDPQIDAIYPSRFPARVTVRRADGTELESSIPAPLGTPANPINAEGLRDKFTDLTAAAMPSAARDRLLAAMLEIDSDRDLAEVIAIAQQASAPSVPSLEVPG
jgi:2-methylcitrate dehydratase PrpD